MKQALKQAEIAEARNEVPVGAIIVQNEQILGVGHNLREASQSRKPAVHSPSREGTRRFF